MSIESFEISPMNKLFGGCSRRFLRICTKKMGRKHLSREKYFCVVKCGEIPLLHLESCMTTDMAHDSCCREA